MDKQGRIRIPSQLAGIADLGKDIVIVGVGFHWEIWDQARWEGYLAQHHQAFDEIAETTFNPPGFSNFEESTEDQRDFADGIIPQRPRQTK